MTHDVATIGAGLSGLAAAVALRAAGKSVVMFDKGRAVGGRLATRRIGEAVFDHGAQFFTVRDQSFQEVVSVWEAAGIARLWCNGFPGAEGPDRDGHPRYFCPGGMTAIAKDLAARLPGGTVLTDHKVTRIHHEKSTWFVEVEGRGTWQAKSLLVTVPAPQAPDLFTDPAIKERLRKIADSMAFDPCLALMAIIDAKDAQGAFPAPGGRRFDNSVLSWGADNHRKCVSPLAGAVTLHASPDFSRRHYDSDPAEVARHMLRAAGLPDVILADESRWQLKKWRYAIPAHPHAERFVEFAPGARIAGDAFGGPRVEGAWLSGTAAALSF